MYHKSPRSILDRIVSGFRFRKAKYKPFVMFRLFSVRLCLLIWFYKSSNFTPSSIFVRSETSNTMVEIPPHELVTEYSLDCVNVCYPIRSTEISDLFRGNYQGQ